MVQRISFTAKGRPITGTRFWCQDVVVVLVVTLPLLTTKPCPANGAAPDLVPGPDELAAPSSMMSVRIFHLALKQLLALLTLDKVLHQARKLSSNKAFSTSKAAHNNALASTALPRKS